MTEFPNTLHGRDAATNEMIEQSQRTRREFVAIAAELARQVAIAQAALERLGERFS
jgi:hypothetical protein